jgi:CIC family chloride channel protein
MGVGYDTINNVLVGNSALMGEIGIALLMAITIVKLIATAVSLTTRWLFRCDGLFQHVLRIQGKFRSTEALEQLLSRTGVRRLMERHLAVSDKLVSRTTAHYLLEHHPQWIVLRDSQQLLQPADLHAYLDQQAQSASSAPVKNGQDERERINLLDIPARRYDLLRIAADANLFEALTLMNQHQLDALWVESLSDSQQPLGIISRAKIDAYYRF